MKTDYSTTPIVQKAAFFKQRNLYPYFRAIQHSDGPHVTIDGQELINISSNNYLGLTHHPYVLAQATQALHRYGSGCTGSRFLNGNLQIHEELESRLAAYMGKESALIFSTGMQTNLGALSSLAAAGDSLLLDADNHASLLDAARLAHGKAYKFPHGDLQRLEYLLANRQSHNQRSFIVVDGVYSTSGELAPLPELVSLAQQYQAYLYIDDAHGLGVMGPEGRGSPSHFACVDEVDFHMGSFSKAFAAIGGVVASSASNIEFLRHCARSFIFSASLPPSVAATVLAGLDLIHEDPSIHQRLWQNVSFMTEALQELGLIHHTPQTPIISIDIGDERKAMQITLFLMDQGVFATPILAPAVAQGAAILRTSYMASHNQSDLEQVVDAFRRVRDKFSL